VNDLIYLLCLESVPGKWLNLINAVRELYETVKSFELYFISAIHLFFVIYRRSVNHQAVMQLS
jgi:hypothetical protein